MNNPKPQLETGHAMGFFFPIAAFVGSLVMMSVICTWGWDVLVKDHIYNCTDDVPLDYLQPGQWIHSPVAVQHVVGHRPMGQPDTIKQGWSPFGLWLLWLLFVGGSLVASGLVAFGASALPNNT